MKDVTDYSLLRHNTFGIDALCRRFIEIETVDDALRLPSILCSEDYPLLIIGGGSNLLLTGNYDGTVLHSAIRGIEPADGDDDTVHLRVGSGETWDDLVKLCVDNGWYGAENLSLIPGDVGATAVQNIGAYGAEASHIIYNIEAVEIATGKMVTIAAADCGYGYRTSRFKTEWRGRYLITHVTYRLHKTFTPLLDYGNIRDVLRRQSTVNGQCSTVNGQCSTVNGQCSMVNGQCLFSPRTQQHDPYIWHDRHEHILQQNCLQAPQIVMIGNSITHYWTDDRSGADAKDYRASWDRLFKGRVARNQGFGFDRIENGLWRIMHGELDGFSAEKVFLLLGTNNLSTNTDEEIVEGMLLLIQAVRQHQPKARIYQCGIMPRRGLLDRVNHINALLKEKLHAQCSMFNVQYVEMTSGLVDERGELIESLFSDGLHPNARGYEVVARNLERYVKE